MTTIVTKAMKFATQAHASIDHRRKYTNDPYIVHPAHVVAIVASVPHTPEMLAAAWLHDVVEDVFPEMGMTRDEGIAMIADEFGMTVADLVDDLTDISKKTDGNRAVRKEIDRAHTAMASPAAKTVKLADVLSNTTSILTHDKKFGRVYLGEMEKLVPVLLEGDPTLVEMVVAAQMQAAVQLMEDN